MMQKQEKLLADLEFRINQLMYTCNSLKEENLSLKAEIEDKKLEVELIHLKFEQLDQKYNNLKIANSIIAGNGQTSVDDAKNKLTKLIQNVDKCISLLKV